MSTAPLAHRATAPVTRGEASTIAQQWVRDSAQSAQSVSAAVHEFDLGYVVWAESPLDSPPLATARGIIDRATGELSVWPALPVETVIEQFRSARSDQPPAARTWDPRAQAERDRTLAVAPANVTYLTVRGRTVVSRSVKGDDEPNHHRLVREFLTDVLPPQYRERGYDRCSEAAALSDALHAEDAGRAAVHEPAISLAAARADLFAGAGMVTYRIREADDPTAGRSGPPCVSCALLGRHFGFLLSPPDSADAEAR